MARTKADAYTKAAIKAPRKQSALKGESASASKSGKSDRHSGGNPYCPRPTPAWQKPITSFFSKGGDKDKGAEKKSMPEASATSSSYVYDFYEHVPSCSKDDLELMEFMDSEVMSDDEESKQDDSAINLESASINDSKLDENAMNLDPVLNIGDSKLDVDAINWNFVPDGEDPKLERDAKHLGSDSSEDDKLQGDAKNSESVYKEDSKLEEDAKNLEPMPKGVKLEEDVMISDSISNEEGFKLNEDVKNLELVSNEDANILPCGGKEAINNGNQDSEAISYEVDYQDDDNSNLPDNSDINAATIGVNASPTVNDLDDQDSSSVDE